MIPEWKVYVVVVWCFAWGLVFGWLIGFAQGAALWRDAWRKSREELDGSPVRRKRA